MRRIFRGFVALFVLVLVSNFAQAPFDLIRQESKTAKTSTAVSPNPDGDAGRVAGLAAVRGISGTGGMPGPALAGGWPPRDLNSLGASVFMNPAVAHAALVHPASRTTQLHPSAASASGKQAPGKGRIATGRLKQGLAMKTAPKNLASSAWR